jgi:hypothetical protein
MEETKTKEGYCHISVVGQNQSLFVILCPDLESWFGVSFALIALLRDLNDSAIGILMKENEIVNISFDFITFNVTRVGTPSRKSVPGVFPD